jgi:hypothetical protein
VGKHSPEPTPAVAVPHQARRLSGRSPATPSAGEYFGCFLRMTEAWKLSAATAKSLLAKSAATGDARCTPNDLTIGRKREVLHRVT